MRPQYFRTPWLVMTVFIILAAGFLITSVLSYQVTRDTIFTSAVTQTLPLISDNIYSEIKEDLADPINVSSLMANDTFLIDWVHGGEESVYDITRYLKNIRESYGYNSAFYVSELTGNYYYYDGILKQISEKDEHDIWYYTFRDSGLAYALDVDNDQAAEGTLTVFINHRLVDDDGIFLGATGVGLQLSGIGERLKDYEKQYNHTIYMVDETGLYQVHADQSLVEKANLTDREGLTDVGHLLVKDDGQIHIHEFEDMGGEEILSLRYIPEFNWFLIVEKNQSDSLTDARHSLWLNVTIGLGVSILVSLLVLWLFRVSSQQLEEVASFDELTGLLNRRVFSHLLMKNIAAVKRSGGTLMLLMLDIDNFKEVNDRFGHVFGDEVLRRIAKTIQNNLRRSDVIGRWGGEEFMVMLTNTSEEKACETAERIRKAVEELEIRQGTIKAQRTVSVGAAKFNLEDEDDTNLIHAVDIALMKAKEEGKNRVASCGE